VLRIAHDLAGLNLAEADLLRRAMSHFDPGKQMQTLQRKFIAGAMQHSGVPAETAGHIWELMAAFAGYGFPKAHAASYAQLSWRSAWCKAHFPAQFLAAVLANWGGYYSQRIYLMEARRLGLSLKAPHVNYSQGEFSVHYHDGQPVLYMGLNQVRELTRRTQRQIIRQRPFHSALEFLQRADPRPSEAQNLAAVGALEGMGEPARLVRELKVASQTRTAKTQPGQMSLFSLSEGDEIAGASPTDEIETWTPEQRAAQQEAILGVSIDYHPLELLAPQLQREGVVTTLEATAQGSGHARVAGMRQTWRRSGADYLMELEDMEGVLEVLVPGSLYNRERAAFTSRIPLIVEGELEPHPEYPEPRLRAEKVARAG
jgi:DNA polymerase-3 subunit alpha